MEADESEEENVEYSLDSGMKSFFFIYTCT